MPSLDEQFQQIEENLRIGYHRQAFEQLRNLIYSLTAAQFANLSPDLEKFAQRFQKKRESQLLATIQERRKLTSTATKDNNNGLSVRTRAALRSKLTALSDYNIFDWSTSYKTFIAEEFDAITGNWNDPLVRSLLLTVMREEFCRHSKEIFNKGYTFKKSPSFTEDHKKLLAARGLVSFLHLPFQESLERLSTTRLAITATIHRQACSAMIAGIIEGFAECDFGEENGKALLHRSTGWQSSLGLLTAADLQKLEPILSSALPFTKLREFLLPLNDALDGLASPRENDFFVIRESTWDDRLKRFTIELLFPVMVGSTQGTRVVAYLNPELLSIGELEQQLNRETAAMLAPLSELLAPLVDDHEELRERVVNTANTAPHQRASQTEQIISFIRSYVSMLTGGDDSVAVLLRYNYADDFPLEQARVSPRFYVNRPSVRNLIPAINSRSGIRLWTSLRRSGKTTSCVRLASESDASDIVFQTCQFTDQEEYANFFYDAVIDALDKGRIHKDFLPSFFKTFAGIEKGSLKNVVLVIDEYETLFEQLDLRSQSDRLLQLSIVQPLLNQLVAFAQENLLVLLGQRPDAHFILLEQNQLSPLVQHDPFPLFEHTNSNQTSEFCELLRKALTFHIPFDAGFADAIYAETHGHPYLTVSMLRDLLDFLIKGGTWNVKKTLTRDSFTTYADLGFTQDNLRRSKHYAFFRKMIAEYLSPRTRKSQPWIFAIHDMLNQIARANGTMVCSEFDFGRIFTARGLDQLDLDPTDLMVNAINGNFLQSVGGYISPRVPIIARLARSVSNT